MKSPSRGDGRTMDQGHGVAGEPRRHPPGRGAPQSDVRMVGWFLGLGNGIPVWGRCTHFGLWGLGCARYEVDFDPPVSPSGEPKV